jgi:hypothetical protein
MVDACAVVSGIGYVSTDFTPEVADTFNGKADELALDGIVAPGALRAGWLDCHYCCEIIARVGGLEQPEGLLAPDDVKRLFADAQWPSLDGLPKGPVPSEYAYNRCAKAFVEACLVQGLAIEFT